MIKHKKIILDEINNIMENVIEIPDIPNTMNF